MLARPFPDVQYEAAPVTWSNVPADRRGMWKSPPDKIGEAIGASIRVGVGDIRIAISRDPH